MKRINTQILFGGHPVYVIPIEDDYVVICKGVKGFLSQIKSFVEHSSPSGQYHFGSRKVTGQPNGEVKIDCLADSHKKAKSIINFCNTHKENEQATIHQHSNA